jgi:ATP-dependent DNA helicase RecG
VDIQAMIAAGESERLEFKASFGKDVIVSLAAFANSRGGRVLVGIADDGRVRGVNVGRETVQRYLNEIKTATYPQLLANADIVEIEGKTLLVFGISEYPVKPVACKDRYYKRVKNSNHLLSLEEIVDLQQQSLNVSYDAYPVKETLDSLDDSLVRRFIDRAKGTGRISLGDDPLTNLVKLKLIRDGRPTLAAMLLFGDHGYAIHIGRFKAADTIIDDLLIKEPLVTALDEAMLFIKKHINLSYHFDGSLQRKERWQYPLEGLRELLLNAVVHRDYKSASDVVIKIFDDRIVFTNPGRLMGNLTVADLQRDDYVSVLRNKLLAEAFYLTGDIEKYGTGFVRVREWLRTYPEVSYSLEEIGDFFKVDIVRSRALTEQDTEHVIEQVPFEAGKGFHGERIPSRPGQETDKAHVTPEVEPEVTPEVSPEVQRLLVALKGQMDRQSLQQDLGLKAEKNFRLVYLRPALDANLIEMTIPDKPRSSKQKYRLTEKGRKLLKIIS